MEGLKHSSAVTRLIAPHLREAFVLVDVGCSGGVAPGWRSFGDKLEIVGFDVSLGAVYELNQQATNQERYFAARVGLPDGHPLRRLSDRFSYWRRNPWFNLAVYAQLEQEKGRDAPVPAPQEDRRPEEEAERYFTETLEADLAAWKPAPRVNPVTLHNGMPPDAADAALMLDNHWELTATVEGEPVFLADALDAASVRAVDFLKIDVDGPDYEIVWSIADRLESLGVLGVGLEVNFFGSDAPHHNTFHNVDRLMRRYGYTLFSLTTRAYAASAVPDSDQGVANGFRGRPLQGDAVYIADPAFALRNSDGALTAQRALKLAGLFALLGLEDQAADALLRARDALAVDGIDVPALVSAIVKEARAVEREAAAQQPVAVNEETAARLAAIERSTTWRMTRPFRDAVTSLRRTAAPKKSADGDDPEN